MDWGDGCVETLNESSSLVHNYERAGAYEIRLTDDFSRIRTSSTEDDDFTLVHAKKLTGLFSNAQLLSAVVMFSHQRSVSLSELDISASGVTTIAKSAFLGCSSLHGRIDLPNVSRLPGEEPIFEGCDGIAEIHFATRNAAAIKSSAGYLADQTLGAVNAVIKFDL